MNPERQWRDTVGLLVACALIIDRATLFANAETVGLSEVLDRAVADAGG